MKTDPKEIINAHPIPSIPLHLHHILKIADDPSFSVTDLEEVILPEASLSFQLLHLANSGYYGGGGPYTSLRQALIRLGTSMVKTIATTLLLMDSMSRVPKLNKTLARICWMRSFLAIEINRSLRSKLTAEKGDFQYWAILASSSARILLSAHFGKKYDELSVLPHLPSPSDEKKLLGISHLELAASLCQYWSLPEESVQILKEINSGKRTEGALSVELSTQLAAAIIRDQSQVKTSVENLEENQIDFLQNLGWSKQELAMQCERGVALMSIISSIAG